MDLREELIRLREETGMNRSVFARYFGIPYRTLQDWELGNRRVPDYLLRLMAYKIQTEKLLKEKHIHPNQTEAHRRDGEKHED